MAQNPTKTEPINVPSLRKLLMSVVPEDDIDRIARDIHYLYILSKVQIKAEQMAEQINGELVKNYPYYIVVELARVCTREDEEYSEELIKRNEETIKRIIKRITMEVNYPLKIGKEDKCVTLDLFIPLPLF